MGRISSVSVSYIATLSASNAMLSSGLPAFYLLLFLTCSLAAAQDDEPISGQYVFRSEVPLQRFDIQTSMPQASRVPAAKNYVFTIAGTHNDKYIIRYLKWTSNTDESARLNKLYYGDDSASIYFLVDRATILTHAERRGSLAWRPTFGVTTLPARYRPQNGGSFSSSVTVGPSVAVNMPLSRYDDVSLAFPVLSYGITSIELNSANTQAPAASTAGTGEAGMESDDSDVDPIQVAAMSLSAGFVMNYKGVQAGIHVGWDFISNNKDYDYDFHGKPWIGFGIGVNILGGKASLEESSNSDQ